MYNKLLLLKTISFSTEVNNARCKKGMQRGPGFIFLNILHAKLSGEKRATKHLKKLKSSSLSDFPLGRPWRIGESRLH